MGFLDKILYSLNIGKIKTIRKAVELLQSGSPGEALKLLDGVKGTVNMAFRYLWHLARGQALEEMKYLEAARDEYTDCIAFKPDQYQAYLFKARVLHALNQPDDALEQLNKLDAMVAVPSEIKERASILRAEVHPKPEQ
jgi:tetratricopeptide (TPR) repeat protein